MTASLMQATVDRSEREYHRSNAEDPAGYDHSSYEHTHPSYMPSFSTPRRNKLIESALFKNTTFSTR